MPIRPVTPTPLARLALVTAVTASLCGCGAHRQPRATSSLPTPAAQSTTKEFFRDLGDLIQLRATAGAGFSGIHVAEVVESPAYSMIPRCATCGDSVPVLRADSVDLVPNTRYAWRPALSTGLSANIYSNRASKAGVGIGTHIVFVPDAQGHTSAFPAATLHVGSPDKEVFFGMVFSPTDRVVLPEGMSSVRAARVGARPEFVRAGTGRSRTLYMGIQIGGVRVSGSESPPGADLANTPPVASIVLRPDTVRVTVGEEATVTAIFLDAGQTVLAGRTGFFATTNTTVAHVQSERADKVLVKGLAAGTTTLRVQRDQLFATIPVIVSAKAAP